MNDILPVILSGGSGTRLWPLSREAHPKQFLPLLGEHSLLQQTSLRLRGLPGADSPLVVANEEHRFMVAEQLRQVGATPAALILEPVGRNTAPAIAVAALQAMSATGASWRAKWPRVRCPTIRCTRGSIRAGTTKRGDPGRAACICM